MARDYIPESTIALRDWTVNIQTQLIPVATRIGWPAAHIAELQTILQQWQTTAQAVIDAQNALEQATGRFSTAKTQALPHLRRLVANLKSTAGFTAGDADAFALRTTFERFDPATYQPTLQAAGGPGGVMLQASRCGADALNLYVRHPGDGSWRLLVGKRSRFPLTDAGASATGAPEVREYRAIGVKGDQEIGIPSAIVTATWSP